MATQRRQALGGKRSSCAKTEEKNREEGLCPRDGKEERFIRPGKRGGNVLTPILGKGEQAESAFNLRISGPKKEAQDVGKKASEWNSARVT